MRSSHNSADAYTREALLTLVGHHRCNTYTARLLATAVVALASASQAADWSDTFIGFRTGRNFSELPNPGDIERNIVNLKYLSGYKYGSNFFNLCPHRPTCMLVAYHPGDGLHPVTTGSAVMANNIHLRSFWPKDD
jgi:hypothetical protein